MCIYIYNTKAFLLRLIKAWKKHQKKKGRWRNWKT